MNAEYRSRSKPLAASRRLCSLGFYGALEICILLLLLLLKECNNNYNNNSNINDVSPVSVLVRNFHVVLVQVILLATDYFD